jgi:hypothetical protein
MIGTRFACGFLAAGMVAHGRRMRPRSRARDRQGASCGPPRAHHQPATLLVVFISNTGDKLKVNDPPK